jgi:hypothetical protein
MTSELSNRGTAGSNSSETLVMRKWRMIIKMSRRNTGGRSGMKKDEGGEVYRENKISSEE